MRPDEINDELHSDEPERAESEEEEVEQEWQERDWDDLGRADREDREMMERERQTLVQSGEDWLAGEQSARTDWLEGEQQAWEQMDKDWRAEKHEDPEWW